MNIADQLSWARADLERRKKEDAVFRQSGGKKALSDTIAMMHVIKTLEKINDLAEVSEAWKKDQT